jgi:hypothetical protein
MPDKRLKRLQYWLCLHQTLNYNPGIKLPHNTLFGKQFLEVISHGIEEQRLLGEPDLQNEKF